MKPSVVIAMLPLCMFTLYAVKCETTADNSDLIFEGGLLIIDTDKAMLYYYNEVEELYNNTEYWNTTVFNGTAIPTFTETDNSTVSNSSLNSSHVGFDTSPVETTTELISTENLEETTIAVDFATLTDSTATKGPISEPPLSTTGSPTEEPMSTMSANASDMTPPMSNNETSLNGTNSTAETTTFLNSSAVNATLSPLDEYGSGLILIGTLRDLTYRDSNGAEWNYSVAAFSRTGSIELRGNLTVEVTGKNALYIESTKGSITINSNVTIDGEVPKSWRSPDGEQTPMFAGGFQGAWGPGGGGDDDTPGGAGHGGHGGGSYKGSQSQPCRSNSSRPSSEVTSAQAATFVGTMVSTMHQTSGTNASRETSSLTSSSNTEFWKTTIGGADPSNTTASDISNTASLNMNSTTSNADNRTVPESTTFSHDSGNSTSMYVFANSTTTDPVSPTTIGNGYLYNCSYGFPYLQGSFKHLLGGSAGGVGSPEMYRMGGGGAIELRARKGTVTIDAVVTARGQSGPKKSNMQPCVGGGSGGLIRLRAHSVHVTPKGSLLVSGGDASGGCVGYGGGGAGGVIQIMTASGNEPVKHDDAFVLDGGWGTPGPGQDGYLLIATESTWGGGSECDEIVDECKCPPVPPSADCPPIPGPVHPSTKPSKSSRTTRGMMTTTRGMETTVPDDSLSTHDITPFTSRPTTRTSPLPEGMTQDDATNYLQDVFDKTTDLTESSTPIEAANVLESVEQVVLMVGRQLAKSRKSGERIHVEVVSEELVMQLEVLDAGSFVGSVLSAGNGSSLASRSATITIDESVVPDNSTGDLIVVGTFFTKIEQYLAGILATPTGLRNGYHVNSAVVSATVEMTENTLDFTDKIKITAANNKKSEGQDSLCVFWNFSIPSESGGAWSTSGCFVDSTNETHTVCKCDHLTNFAVLLQTTDITLPPGHERALEILTKLGLGVSLICLLVALVILAALLRSLKNFESASIHLNLVVALTLADFFFLIGADDTGNKLWCKVVAGILHYTYTVTFMWMLMEGIHLYIRVVRVLHPPPRGILKYFFIAAWGLPAIIVGATAIATPDSYGSSKACWLDTTKGAIWAFAGPVLVIIGVNIVFLAVVMVRFVSVKSIAKQSKWKQTKKTTRAAVILLPLLGITWLFGLLAIDENTLVFMYLFVILNSLQGFFIFLFHCLTNDDVISTLRIKLRKSRSRINFRQSWPSEIKTSLMFSPLRRKKKNSVHPSTQTTETEVDQTPRNSMGHWTDAIEHTF